METARLSLSRTTSLVTEHMLSSILKSLRDYKLTDTTNPTDLKAQHLPSPVVEVLRKYRATNAITSSKSQ